MCDRSLPCFEDHSIVVRIAADFGDSENAPDESITGANEEPPRRSKVSGVDANNDGTIFEIAHGSGSITQLATFDAATTGSSPGGDIIIDSAGDLFGTTANGGAAGCGTVWMLSVGSTSISTLASFSPVVINGVGQNPGADGIAIDHSGNLWGTTAGNAASGSFGTVWELPNGTASIVTVTSFNGTNGATPTGGIAIDGSGDVFGTTEFGGDNFNTAGAPQGSGVVWELPTGLTQVSDLADFDDPSVGQFPLGRVVLDQVGDLFGTTSIGGNATASFTGDGTVWEIPAQTVSPRTIENFNGTGGANPKGALVTDAVGNVFGTTTGGGALGGGGIFEMDFAGANSSSSSLTPSVTKSNLPANIPTGKIVHGTASVSVSNPTSTIVRNVFTVAVYAAPDGIIDGSAIKIGSLTRTLVVPKKAKTTVSVSIPSFHSGARSRNVYAPRANNQQRGKRIQRHHRPSHHRRRADHHALRIADENHASGRARQWRESEGRGAAQNHEQREREFDRDTHDRSGLHSCRKRYAGDANRVADAEGDRSRRRIDLTLAIPITSIPSGLTGSYTLSAQVTDTNGVVTSATGASTYTLSAPAVALAATIASIKPTAFTSTSKGNATISLSISNTGNVPIGTSAAIGNFVVALGLAQGGVQVVSLGSFNRALAINPGQHKTLALTFSAKLLASITAGSYSPIATVTLAGTAFSTSTTGSQTVTVG